ncbi:MAG: hypothetical protein IIB60_02320 [Planctomycetes bacterium]|nr:hypothetical protein [Planctomycetota bacterium]
MKLRWTIKTRRGRLDVNRVRALYARFGRYVRPHRWRLLCALGAALGTIAMSVAAPWPIKIIFDYILTDKMRPSRITELLSRVASTPTSTLAWVCAAILPIVLLEALFSYARDVLLAHTGQHVVGKIRQDLFRH